MGENITCFIADGCLSHKTAVASGALVMYLRYLCEPDAALIFNKSRYARSIKSVEPEKAPKPALNLIPDPIVKVGNGVNNAPKVIGQADNYNKPPLMFDDKRGFVNESLDEIEDARVQDGGKKFIHGDEIGNQHFALNRQQIHPPDIQGNLNRLHMNREIETQLGNDDGGDDGDDELDEEDDDEDEDDEYAYGNNDGKGNREDGYEYDNENGKLDGDDQDEDNDYDEAPVDPHRHPAVLKPGQYHNTDDGDDLDDEYDADEDNDEEDEDYDGDYADNKVNEIAHPHINARNLGQNKNKNYDHAVYDQYEKSINHDKDYKYDDDEEDEEEDDYEYDDENDNVEIKKPEDEKQPFELIGSEKQSQKIQEKQSHTDVHISKTSVPAKTVFIVFLLCFSVVLLLMYRFIRKRRIRIRFNPKYFHV